MRRAANAVMSAFGLGDGVPASPHQGASTGRRMGGWRPTGGGPNAVVQASQPELVRRSRDFRRNNHHGKRVLDLVSTHTVGMGIKPRPLCRNAQVREALVALWDVWTAQADADGVLDFYGLQALAASEMAEGGESFARLRTRRLSDGLAVPFQIQLLPTEMVPLDYQQPNGANSVTQGIERTTLGQRAAYWIYPQHPGELATMGTVSAFPIRVAATDVCHLYNVTRIGQLRGLPWLAAALTTLRQVDQYIDAELERKKLAASLVGFIKKAAGKGVDPEELAEAWGEVQKELGGLPTVAFEPGTFQYLDLDEDVVMNQTVDVGGQFEQFLSANYRGVSAAVGMLYEEVTGDWKNANDRTFRAQFGTFKRQVRQWQFNLLCHQFNRPIWNRFVDLAIASGALVVPASVLDTEVRRVEWRPERWEYINPKQDVDATLAEIGGGLTSRQAAVADRGDDVEQIDEQRAADKEREERLGVPVVPAGKAGDTGTGQGDPSTDPAERQGSNPRLPPWP